MAVAVIAFVATANAQQTISSSFFGFDINQWYGPNGPTGELWPDEVGVSFGVWRSLGAQVNWDQLVMPNGTGCQYDFTKFDAYAKQATDSNEDILYTVFETPGCANENMPNNVPPSDVFSGDNYWIDFITQLYTHSQNLGHHIKYWECWNEPNIYGVHGSWYGTIAQLQQMCSDLHATIHWLDQIKGDVYVLTPPWSAAPAPNLPQSQRDCLSFLSTTGWLVGSGDVPDTCNSTTCTEFQQYLEWPQGTALPGIKSADIVSFHSYLSPDQTQAINVWGINPNTQEPNCANANVPYVTNHVEDIATAVENALGVSPPLPIVSTEGSNNGVNNSTYGDTNNPEESAAFLAQYFVSFMDRGVSNVTWFGYDYSGGYGLLENPGTSSPTLDENGEAYVNLYKWTDGNSITNAQYVYQGTTIYGVNLTYNNHPALILWDDSQTCLINEPCTTGSVDVNARGGSFTNWKDLDNNTYTILTNGNAQVGLKPVLVYQNP
jgi:hypothetical protein